MDLCRCTHQEPHSQHTRCYLAVASDQTGFCYSSPDWPWVKVVCFCQTDNWVPTKELLDINSIVIPRIDWCSRWKTSVLLTAQWPSISSYQHSIMKYIVLHTNAEVQKYQGKEVKRTSQCRRVIHLQFQARRLACRFEIFSWCGQVLWNLLYFAIDTKIGMKHFSNMFQVTSFWNYFFMYVKL